MKKLFLGFLIGIILTVPLSTYAGITLAKKLSGRLLLQTQDAGRIWYVNPVNNERYYIKNGEEAMRIFRMLSLGVTNESLGQIPISKNSVKVENEEAIQAQGSIVADYPAGPLGINKEKLEKELNKESQKQPSGSYTLEDMIYSTVKIVCYDYSGARHWGSSFLWSNVNDNSRYLITNDHVIRGSKSCYAINQHESFRLDLNESGDWNKYTDIEALSIEPTELAYSKSLRGLPMCSRQVPRGTKVYVIGYPAYNSSDDFATLTEGIISSYAKPDDRRLPTNDYYVTAVTDNGNSGGPAIALEDGEYCIAGVTTWTSTGETQTQGMVQNIYNIEHVD